jgi:hypothetical protein
MDEKPRTLTFRALLIGISGIVFLGYWVAWHEVVVGTTVPYGIAENSPPAAAVGIFLGILVLVGAVTTLNRRWRLQRGELILIYSMLLVAAPLTDQGMWRRLPGLMTAVPREKPRLLDSYSEKLWPHGRHLVKNRRFQEDGPGWLGDHGMHLSHPERAEIVPAEDSQVGPVNVLRIRNPDPDEGEEVETTFRIRIPRHREDGTENVVPAEMYFAMALVRLEELGGHSELAVEIVSDAGDDTEIFSFSREVKDKYSTPGGYTRLVEKYVQMPRSTEEYADLIFRLEGPGTAYLTDVGFFSNEAVYRMYAGMNEIGEADLDKLPQNEREALLVEPEGFLGKVGYRLKAYIPWGQWATPLWYWSSISVAIFLALFGIGVIMRKQWSENERFGYPLVVLPRLLTEEREEDGRAFYAVTKRPVFVIGVIAALVFSILQGAAYYVPGLPDPTINVNVQSFFSSEPMKRFILGFYHEGSTFKVILLFTAIAFFIDLEMLASLIVFFWISKLPYYLGEIYGWNTIKGVGNNSFPFTNEQHIGAFLILALIVLYKARKHLAGVIRRVVGAAGGVDDSREAVSYRAALAIVLLSLAFIAYWGFDTGLGAGSALIFFTFIIICGFSAARIRAEVGAPMTYFTPYVPTLIFFLMGGVAFFGMETMVLATAAGGFMAVAQFLMFAPSQVEMLHLADQEEKVSPSGVSWGLLVGMLGGILIGGYTLLVWVYGQGGDNVPGWGWVGGYGWYFGSLSTALDEMDRVATAEDGHSGLIASWTGVGVGGGMTLLLTALRARFVGFWLHPLGYILSNTYMIYMCWGSLHVAYAVKWIALRVGGPRFIRDQMAPLFGGIFTGAVCGIILWTIVAVILRSQGVSDVFLAFP